MNWFEPDDQTVITLRTRQVVVDVKGAQRHAVVPRYDLKLGVGRNFVRGHQALIEWLRARAVRCLITGPVFTRFEHRGRDSAIAR